MYLECEALCPPLTRLSHPAQALVVKISCPARKRQCALYLEPITFLPRGKQGQRQEVAMFEMIDDEKPSAERRKAFLTKAVLFVVAIGLVAGVIYLIAFHTM